MQTKNLLLRKERLCRGWSQVRLSIEAEVSLSTVERAERGEGIRGDSLQRLCICLNKTPEQLGLLRIESESQECSEPTNSMAVATTPQGAESDEEMKRRKALQVLGEIGFTLVGASHGLLPLPSYDQLAGEQTKPIRIETLDHFEKLTQAGWLLAQGSELEMLDNVLSSYLPKLKTIAQQPSIHQLKAINLVSQSYQLIGLLMFHRNNHATREVYCKQAVEYSKLTEDHTLQVSSFIHLANTYYYSNRPLKALQTYQEALGHIDKISPLLRGRVYIMLAESYAQCRQEQDAYRYIGLAHESFSEHLEDLPHLHYSDHGLSSLYLWEGLTHLNLDQPRDAWEAFEQVGGLQPRIIVSERNRVEVLNHQAEAAIALRDQELFKVYLEAGIKGATELNSERRRQEAREVYGQARKVWPNDSKIRDLQELFIS